MEFQVSQPRPDSTYEINLENFPGALCDWNGTGKIPALVQSSGKNSPEKFTKKSAMKKNQKIFPALHAIVCPDTTGFPSRSISTSESGVTRKNRHVPCFDRSQSSAVMALSRAMIRSWAISSLNSSASCRVAARISGANITRVNVTGTFETMAMSKTRSGPLIAS